MSDELRLMIWVSITLAALGVLVISGGLRMLCREVAINTAELQRSSDINQKLLDSIADAARVFPQTNGSIKYKTMWD